MALLRTVEKHVGKQKRFCGRHSAIGKVLLVMQSLLTKSVERPWFQWALDQALYQCGTVYCRTWSCFWLCLYPPQWMYL